MVEADQVREKLGAVADPVFLLETLFADAPVAAAIADLDGHCVAVNRMFRELFGTPPPEHSLWRDDRIVAFDLPGQVRRVAAGETVVVPTCWYDTRGGGAPRRVAVELTITPLPDRSQAIHHVALYYRDVTAAHELAERQRTVAERTLEEHNVRLREANRLKSEFLAAMSHELRTPLNTIIGFSELVFYGRVAPGSDEHHEFMGDILQGSRHLMQLLNDVLDLATIEAGKLELRPEPVIVPTVIAEVVSELRTSSLQKRIRVDVETDGALEIVVIDPARFRQVVFNYLSNALKYTPEGGRVVVRTRPDRDERFRLEVEDSGIGIAPEHMDWLFRALSPYASGSNPLQGTGLGLALTRRIVEAQGGTVGVHSRVGHGSTFHAVLPRQSAATTAAMIPATPYT
ncbi:MAG TPA: ATP-binding protein [Kofleriaceae bacterium]|nr:ATP-binding protein [Kofleriaceae bacterium]